MSSIADEWAQFQQHAELLRQKIADAQLLMRMIAASVTVNNSHIAAPPSDPPNAAWDSFPASCFVLAPELKSLRSVWQEWKHGVAAQPPIEYMEQRYGSLDWVRDAHQRQLVLIRAKIVQEIEYHLDHGRELEEIFVVGALHLEQLGNNMTRLAAKIQQNIELRRATLFEDSEH